MSGAPYTNSHWIYRVRVLIREGLGVEDIAVKLSCDVQAVRNEVKILREMGVLSDMFGQKT